MALIPSAITTPQLSQTSVTLIIGHPGALPHAGGTYETMPEAGMKEPFSDEWELTALLRSTGPIGSELFWLLTRRTMPVFWCEARSSGTFLLYGSFVDATREQPQERHMHGLIYLIGLIVVILAILSFFGLR